MARKNLLTESELRRFMKLAEMRPLGEEKIQEMYGGSMPGARDEEEGEMDMDMDMPGDDAPGMDDEPAMDMDAGGDGDMELSDDEAQAIIDLADKLRAAMGDDRDAGMGMDSEAPEGGDAEMEMDADDDPMMESDEESLEEGEEDSLEEGAHEEGEKDKEDDRPVKESSEDEIVAEVARRVAERLQATNKKEQVVDALAERIMNRLTK